MTPAAKRMKRPEVARNALTDREREELFAALLNKLGAVMNRIASESKARNRV